MANLDHLYPENLRHRAFIDHENGTLVALAGPGTGKTYSLLLRIKELTEDRHIDSSTICYLTFIREIARAFKDDLQLKYPGTIIPQYIATSTLHSLACRLIRNRGYTIQLDQHLCILNLGDNKDDISSIAISDMKFMLQHVTTLQSEKNLRQHLKFIKTAWQNAQSTTSLGCDTTSVEQTYQAYSRSLKVLDWDEVIILATSLYSEESDRPAWIKSYQHLLIDEYQDFNVAEQVLLERISESALSRIIVGDDDQSIYSGRGASPKGIRELVQDPEMNSVSLVQCRRCSGQIVQAVNSFLSSMHTNPKFLKAVNSGGMVSIKSFKSAKAEADYLVEYIKGILGQINENTPPYDGIVCLFPSNKVLLQYLKEFKERGLNCKCKDSSNTLDDKMWVRILGKLAFQQNQPFLERLILERFPDFKPRHKREIIAALLNGYTSVSSAMASIEADCGWSKPALTSISAYNTFVQSLTSRDAKRIASCIDSVLSNGSQCNPYYVEDFLATADETSLEDSLDILIYKIYRDSDEDDVEADLEPAVELLTLHSSKGLTRRHVILPGLEQCWLPSNAIGDDLEERHRLFLVGITRAMDSLLITYPLTRARGDSLNYPAVGRGELSEFAKKLGVHIES